MVSTTTTMTHCNSPQSNKKQHDLPQIRIRATASPAAAPAIVTLGKEVTTATLSHAIPVTDLQAYLAEVYTVRAVAADMTAPNKTMLVATAPMSSLLPALVSSSTVSVVNYAIAPSALSSSSPSSSSSDGDDDYEDKSSSSDSAKASQNEDDLQILLGFALLTRHGPTQPQQEPEPCLAQQHAPSSAASSPSSIQLQRLYIGGFARGMGVGTRLLRAVESVGREEKRRNVWLQVPQGNLPARKAYERWGFERVGECEIEVAGFGQRGGWVMGKDVV